MDEKPFYEHYFLFNISPEEIIFKSSKHIVNYLLDIYYILE